jgi:hypothetical protein
MMEVPSGNFKTSNIHGRWARFRAQKTLIIKITKLVSG